MRMVDRPERTPVDIGTGDPTFPLRNEINRLKQELERTQEQRTNALMQAQRAFEIADESMIELLISHGVPDQSIVCGQSGAVGLVDDDSCEVADIAEACEPIRDAYVWLKKRGLAELLPDGTIYLRIEP